MKINISHSRLQGTSLFLAIVLAAVVVVVGGCTVIQLRKFMKRVDGMQDRRIEGTNDGSLFLPPGSTPSTLYAVAQKVWFEYVDIPDDPAFSLNAGEIGQGVVGNPLQMLALLRPDGRVVLTMTNLTDWTLQSYEDLGILRDAYGLPPLVSSYNLPEAVLVTLQRSTNLVTWENATVLRLQTNVPTFYSEERRPHTFYRTVQ
jgi:hypothetical protein